MYIVSACLLGIKCKYDGGDNLNCSLLGKINKLKGVLPLCPEQLGGLPTPRMPAELKGGDGYAVLEGRARVIQRNGFDVTGYYIKGAEQTYRLSKIFQANRALLKSGSPSCGCGFIRDGSFRGRWREGDGVTTALLKENGVEVYSEDKISELA